MLVCGFTSNSRSVLTWRCTEEVERLCAEGKSRLWREFREIREGAVEELQLMSPHQFFPSSLVVLQLEADTESASLPDFALVQSKTSSEKKGRDLRLNT